MIKTKALTMTDDVEQLKIKGLEVSRVTSDGSYDKLRSITLRDADGTEFEFAGADCSHRIEVHIPRPPKKVQKWAIVGELDKIEIEQVFDKKTDADECLQRISERLQTDDFSLKVEKREIEE